MTSEIDTPITQPPKSKPRALHLENPWTQILHRWYLAKLKHCPSLIALNQKAISDAKSLLEHLRSDATKAWLKSHPEMRSSMALSEKSALDCIEKNQSIISRHQASMQTMKNKLIRYGFIERQQ